MGKSRNASKEKNTTVVLGQQTHQFLVLRYNGLLKNARLTASAEVIF